MLRRHFMINTDSSILNIPNNEIWYISSDGNIVTPFDLGALPPIVSNTYNGGKGIIKFETDITNIGNRAFYRCSSLTYIIIPNSVISIGDNAFRSCFSLTSVTIPNSVTSIGDRAFYECYPLTSINVDSNNPNYSSVDGVLFNKDKTTLIKYPEGKRGAYTILNSVTSIEGYAFYGCKSLTTITIPNSVKMIGDNAFGIIPTKLLFSKLYSTYTNKIFSTSISSVNVTYNVEFNISEIPTDYNISLMLQKSDGKYTITYNVYTDYAPCKDQALALVNDKTIVNVYHIDGTPWT